MNSALKQLTGFSEFRGEQQAVISSVLRGESGLLVAPTGSGKSLCYQLPSRMLDGLTLVISPLIALMKDQVDQAKKMGLKCTFINSSLSKSEREDRYRRLAEGGYELLYVTPERFRKAEFKEALLKNQVSLLAVDEAHCISDWGHDFRPDYTRLGEIRSLVGEPVTLALTATATKEVEADILKQLNISDSGKIYRDGIERPNLSLRVEDVYGIDEKVRGLIGLRHLHPGPAIVYFALISSLQKISHELRKLNIEHLIYHGQLNEKLRRKMQEQFMSSNDVLILATPAFGLGVNKADVRSVIHAEIPGSIEAYYQEVGRAGRDGKQANCVLFYDGDDVSIQMDFIKWSSPEPSFIRQVFQLVERHPDKVKADGADFLRGELNFYNRRDFRVETALNLLERWDCIERVQSSNEIKVIGELPEEYLDEDLAKRKWRRQNEKLHELVEWVKLETCRAKRIHEYFGVEDTKPCGVCENCESQR